MLKSCLGKKKKTHKTITLDIDANNKITNLDNLSHKLIYTNLKKKYIKELETLHHAVDNLKTTQLYQTLKKNKLDNKNKDLTCQICFDKNVNRILIPCGHLVCDICIKDNYQCFFCRKLIDNIQTIYFS